MPPGLDIDHEKRLDGTMPPYAQHVVVKTGMDDWASRIEEEEKEEAGGGVNFARGLKELVGRGGMFFDVCMVWLFGWLVGFVHVFITTGGTYR